MLLCFHQSLYPMKTCRVLIEFCTVAKLFLTLNCCFFLFICDPWVCNSELESWTFQAVLLLKQKPDYGKMYWMCPIQVFYWIILILSHLQSVRWYSPYCWASEEFLLNYGRSVYSSTMPTDLFDFVLEFFLSCSSKLSLFTSFCCCSFLLVWSELILQLSRWWY